MKCLMSSFSIISQSFVKSGEAYHRPFLHYFHLPESERTVPCITPVLVCASSCEGDRSHPNHISIVINHNPQVVIHIRINPNENIRRINQLKKIV